jgi:hypothetical protein
MVINGNKNKKVATSNPIPSQDFFSFWWEFYSISLHPFAFVSL